MSVKCLKKKEKQKSFCSPFRRNVLFSVLSIDISALFHYAFSAASWYSSISSRICSHFSLRSPGHLLPGREFRPDASLWPPYGPPRYRGPSESSSACLCSRRYPRRDTARYSGKEPLSPADSPVRRLFQIK